MISTIARSCALAVGLGFADARWFGCLIGLDFFNVLDRDPAAGFGGEADIGPATGLVDQLAERAGRGIDHLRRGARGVGVQDGFFRGDDCLARDGGELGVVGEIAPAECAGGGEQRADDEGGEGGQAQAGAGAGGGEEEEEPKKKKARKAS